MNERRKETLPALHRKLKVMLLNNLKRHFCSNIITTTLNSSKKKIPCRHKKLAVSHAQKALTEYLHSTRSIPYAFADQISKNSFHSLSNLISKLGSFSPKNLDSFTKKVEKFLRYNPINEFEFFFESIGIHHTRVSSLLPNDKFFFCDDESLLDSACVLCEFGFPWDKLGMIYTESGFMFRKNGSEIKGRLCLLKRYGFCNVQIVGICLTFPFVFGAEEGGFIDDEVDRLLSDLRLVFLDFDLGGCVEGNVDVWYDVCRKIKVFYDLSDGKGKIGELIGRNKHLILEYGEEELIEKVEFFCRFSVEKEEIARLILQGSELLSLNLEATINVLKLLKHIGMDSKGLGDVKKNYAHALGTIKMANLPNVMRAMGLREWFFDKIKDGNHKLLVDFITSYPNEEHDKGYQSGFKAIHDARLPSHNMSKLNFMHTIGFGENAITMNILNHMHGTSEELQKRFDCLLHLGIEFSKLCKIITKLPKILSQNPETLEKKINFLCQDMGHSLELLDTFPAFICFDLENRIKPRFRFHMWALEKRLYSKNYSIASMVATSDKGFVGRVFKIHPAAPKHWFEQFYPNKFRAS